MSIHSDPVKSRTAKLTISSEAALPKWFTRHSGDLTQPRIKEEFHHQMETLMSKQRCLGVTRTQYIVFGGFVSLLFLLVPITYHFQAKSSQNSMWTSCGDSPTMARERGCSFDLITFAWQMPKCYDGALVEEFASWESWTFWTDQHGNHTVSLEEARKGNAELWLPWQYHVVHCTFVWRQMHRAYESGWIDEHSRSYQHTMHCQKMLLMDCRDEGRFCILPNDTVVTGADLIYPACKKVDKRSPWDGFSANQTDPYA